MCGAVRCGGCGYALFMCADSMTCKCRVTCIAQIAGGPGICIKLIINENEMKINLAGNGAK